MVLPSARPPAVAAPATIAPPDGPTASSVAKAARLEDDALRKLGALALAVPAVIAIYLGSRLRRSPARRFAAGIGAFAIVGLVLVASLPPAQSTAAPASGKPAPVSATLLDAVRTSHPLTAPFEVRFGAPMD